MIVLSRPLVNLYFIPRLERIYGLLFEAKKKDPPIAATTLLAK